MAVCQDLIGKDEGTVEGFNLDPLSDTSEFMPIILGENAQVL